MDKVDLVQTRQELDLRPQLERLDAFLLRSAGVDPAALSFEFRPLWQLDAAQKAQVALSKAQTTAVYAGLNLWPVDVTAGLVRSQLLEDGVYPGAEGVFAADETDSRPFEPKQTGPDWVQSQIVDFSPNQPRDPDGRWTAGGGGAFVTGPLPGAPFIHAMTGLGSPVGRPNRVAGGPSDEPVAGETPQEQENKQEHNQQHELQSGLERATGIPTLEPGKISVPAPPGAGAGTLRQVPAASLPPDKTPGGVLRGFAGPKSMRTWQNQMIERGWTASQIEEAIQSGQRFPAQNRINRASGATRYVHQGTGRSVVIDDTTGQVIQLQGYGFKND